MDIKELIKSNNMKVTKSRVEILKLLVENEGSYQVDEIYDILKKSGFEIDLSTVYRTLDSFYTKGLVDKFSLGDDRNTYSFNHHKHKHKLSCEICDKEVEIDCPMNTVEEIIKKTTGYTLVEHHLDFRAVCEDCRKKEKNT